MKILMVGPFPKDGDKIKGGVESVCVNLVQGFVFCKEIEVIFLSFHKDIKKEETNQISDNVVIKYIPFGKIKSIKFELAFHAKKIIYSFAKDFRPDIIHIQGNGSSLLQFKRRYSDKIIVTQHGILSEEIKYIKTLRSRINHRISIYIETLFKRKVKNWIFISQYNKHLAQADNYNISNEELIFNPINSNFFNNNQISKFSNKKIYYVGGIIKRKGLLDLIKAIANLNKLNCNYELFVIGGFSDEIYKFQIEEFINEQNLKQQIHFCGWKNTEEIIQLTYEISIFVLPSYQETLPVVIAEAMAMGKIVVATNVAGIPEMIQDKYNGFLFERGNIDQLTSLLQKIYHSEFKTLSEITKNAKHFAIINFSPKAIAGKTIRYYRKLNCIC